MNSTDVFSCLDGKKCKNVQGEMRKIELGE